MNMNKIRYGPPLIYDLNQKNGSVQKIFVEKTFNL